MFKPYHQRFLKVKIMSLSAESKIIRQQEKKCFGERLRNLLYDHRVNVVRVETRAAFIAYAYLRGRTLESIEGKRSGYIPFHRAQSVIKKFGTDKAFDGFRAWYLQPTNA